MGRTGAVIGLAAAMAFVGCGGTPFSTGEIAGRLDAGGIESGVPAEIGTSDAAGADEYWVGLPEAAAKDAGAGAHDARAPVEASAPPPDARAPSIDSAVPPCACCYASGRFVVSPPTVSPSGWHYGATALDTISGLTWLVNPTETSIGTSNWQIVCKESGPPPRTGWRLPTPAEMLGIVLSGCNPAFAAPFSGQNGFRTDDVFFTSDPAQCVQPYTGAVVACDRGSAYACVAD